MKRKTETLVIISFTILFININSSCKQIFDSIFGKWGIVIIVVFYYGILWFLNNLILKPEKEDNLKFLLALFTIVLNFIF